MTPDLCAGLGVNSAEPGDRGHIMATCTVTWSANVARRAIRKYFWRRFMTPFGLLYLASFPLLIGGIWVVYSMAGANWFVGAFGLVLVMNVIIQGTYYFVLPRAYVKRLSDPARQTAEVETSADGIRVAMGRSAAFRKWSAFKYVWIYDDFVILAKGWLSMGFVFIPTQGISPEVRGDLEAASEGRPIG